MKEKQSTAKADKTEPKSSGMSVGQNGAENKNNTITISNGMFITIGVIIVLSLATIIIMSIFLSSKSNEMFSLIKAIANVIFAVATAIGIVVGMLKSRHRFIKAMGIPVAIIVAVGVFSFFYSITPSDSEKEGGKTSNTTTDSNATVTETESTTASVAEVEYVIPPPEPPKMLDVWKDIAQDNKDVKEYEDIEKEVVAVIGGGNVMDKDTANKKYDDIYHFSEEFSSNNEFNRISTILQEANSIFDFFEKSGMLQNDADSHFETHKYPKSDGGFQLLNTSSEIIHYGMNYAELVNYL